VANFSGWTYAAVNAIASKVANIQFSLYASKARSTRSETTELLTLLDAVNGSMTKARRGPDAKARKTATSDTGPNDLYLCAAKEALTALNRERHGFTNVLST
jgi:hypothetical protein